MIRQHPFLTGIVAGLLLGLGLLLSGVSFGSGAGPVDQCRFIVSQADAGRCAEQLRTAEAGP